MRDRLLVELPAGTPSALRGVVAFGHPRGLLLGGSNGLL